MNFTYRLKEPNSNKKSLIYFRAYFAKEKREFIYSTGESIKPKEWDFENYQPNNLNGRNKLAEKHRTINRQLNRYSDFFQQVVNQYKNIGEELTIDIIRSRFNEQFKRVKSKDTFFTIYDEFLKYRKNDYSGNSISESTLNRYRYSKTLLQDFNNDYKVKLSLENFDEKVFNLFLKYSIEVKRHSANTLNRNIGLL